MHTIRRENEFVDSTANLKFVKEQIAAAAERSGREPDDVSLVAVSKAFKAATIKPIIAAGQRVFGENRVQEALGKWPPLRAKYPEIRLHLIGSLQSNKASEAMSLFDVIETVDRPKLVDAIARLRDRNGYCPDLLVQVNIGEEPQKAGVWPGKADALLIDAEQNLRFQCVV